MCALHVARCVVGGAGNRGRGPLSGGFSRPFAGRTGVASFRVHAFGNTFCGVDCDVDLCAGSGVVWSRAAMSVERHRARRPSLINGSQKTPDLDASRPD